MISRRKLKRQLLIVLAIATALAVIYVAYSVIKISKRPKPKIQEAKYSLEYYKLPKDFSEDDVVSIIGKMKGDPDFVFYFHVLDDQKMKRAAGDAAGILLAKNDKDQLYTEMEVLKGRVRQLAALFYYTEYKEEYYRNPLEFPTLNRLMWDFLYEEFKLTLVAIGYKTLYDPEYTLRFSWDVLTVNAAKKLQRVIFKLQATHTKTNH